MAEDWNRMSFEFLSNLNQSMILSPCTSCSAASRGNGDEKSRQTNFYVKTVNLRLQSLSSF